MRDLAVDEIQGRADLLASNVDNNLIQDAWLKTFDLNFEEGTNLILSVTEKENKIELDGGANRIVANAGRLAIGGDIHSKRLLYYDESGNRFETAAFSAGTSNLMFSSQENLLFANGSEQTYNRSELSDMLIIDLESKAVVRKIKAPAFGPTRLSRSVTSFSVAQNKIALSLVDSAESFSGSEHEPIIPAIVVLDFPAQ
jgi:hypothetical protein